MEKPYRAVTVSRQMGSGGTYIGYQVANALGFSYLDREILSRTASLLNRDEVSLEEYEEKSSTFVDRLLRSFAFGTPEIAYVPKERPVYDRELFIVESRIIKEVVEKHDAVIMGRAGFRVLKDRERTVHLFVHAPREYRIERVMETSGADDRKAAQARVEESDRRRTRFIKDMVGIEWTDSRNYHLSVDSSVLGLEESTRVVLDFVKTALP